MPLSLPLGLRRLPLMLPGCLATLPLIIWAISSIRQLAINTPLDCLAINIGLLTGLRLSLLWGHARFSADINIDWGFDIVRQIIDWVWAWALPGWLPRLYCFCQYYATIGLLLAYAWLTLPLSLPIRRRRCHDWATTLIRHFAACHFLRFAISVSSSLIFANICRCHCWAAMLMPLFSLAIFTPRY